MVKLGRENGTKFGNGLLRTAGVEGDELNLSKQLGGDTATVLAVVCALLGSLRALDLSDNALGPEGGDALAESLKGNSALQYLKQAAATPKRLLFCQCPLTSLLSHHIHSAPRLQSRAEQTHRRGQTGGQRRRGQHRPHPRLVQAAAVRHATLTALVTSVVASPPILASRTPIWPDMAGTLEGGGGVWHRAKTTVPNTHANVQHSPQRNYQVPGFVPIEAP